jgi:precorrin-2 dehydrogenase/sirohydrochlorin ferrochelatase
MKGYPILLVNLHRARCVVVGGGEVAARKVESLRAADAQVSVISPHLHPALESLAAAGGVQVIRRAYRRGDLEGAFLAIAATDEPAVNQAAWEEARARGMLINVVDDPEHCNFFVPAVVRQGDLVIAVSTGGDNPALARCLRERLEAEFGPAYAPFLELAARLRERVKAALPSACQPAFWDCLLDSDVLPLLEAGLAQAAQERAEQILIDLSETKIGGEEHRG